MVPLAICFSETKAFDPPITYQYDLLDRVVWVKDGLDNVTETTYDANGMITEIKTTYVDDSVRIHSQRSYDAADRLVAETDANGNTTTFEYDPQGNTVKITDDNDNGSRFEYDSQDRRTATLNENGHRWQTVYDAAGQAVAQISPDGKKSRFVYDAIGQLSTATSPLDNTTVFQYDANGNTTRTTDANSNNTDLTFDGFNRVKTTTDSEGQITSYEYDLLGNRTKITDAENHITTFIYDDLGRLTAETNPLGQSTAYTYYQTGQLRTQTDRNGAVSHFSYDALNRLTQTDFITDETSETRTYDAFGNLATLGNSDVTYSYSYDANNRLTRKTDGRSGKSLHYSYDTSGNISQKIDYQGTTTTYQYDSSNRLVGLSNPDHTRVAYQYDGNGRLLTRILSSGAKSKYRYDNDGRLIGLDNFSSSDALVHSQGFTPDNVGNIVSLTNGAEAIPLLYDDTYQLSSADDRSYTYDSAGNRLTDTIGGVTRYFTYDNGNRLLNIRSDSLLGPVLNAFTYDANGNRLTKKDGSGTTIESYIYNQQNRIRSLTNSNGTLSFKYDPYGYRVEKNGPNGLRRYYLEGEHLEAITNQYDQPLVTYFRGVVVDEIIHGWEYSDTKTATHTLATDNRYRASLTFHHNHQRSVAAITDLKGVVLQTTHYAPFGKTLATTGTLDNALLYTGRELDSESGLYYYRARYYDSELGRFLTEDPLGFEAGVNFYAYVGNNPVNNTDPTGMIFESGWDVANVGMGL